MMTDSVRCTADAANKFTCEVQLDADFKAPEVAQSQPQIQSQPPASNPAVSTLVSTFVSKTLVPAPPAPLISGESLLKCASSEISVILAASARKSPIMAGLAMVKVALDAGACLTLAHNDAAQRNAENYCVAQGGTVKSVEGEKTICEVREKAQ
jgi:hypothetical protein